MSKIKITQVVVHEYELEYGDQYYPGLTQDEAMEIERQQCMQTLFDDVQNGAPNVYKHLVNVSVVD
jgi:hypothetical protein